MRWVFACSLFGVVACSAPVPCPAAPPSAAAAPPTASVVPSAPAVPARSAPHIDAQEPVERTRDAVIAAFAARAPQRLDALYSANMRAALPLEKTARLVEAVFADKGAMQSARIEPNTPNSPRHGTYRVRAERGEVMLELSVADDGTILGMKVTPPPAPDPEVRRSTLPLALPFKGEWLVFWGGSTEDVNQHVRHKSQRRAADLFVVDADGKSHRGDGKDVHDYFAYGKDVLAAADGKVVTVADGVPDSVPGVLNGYAAVGNFVVVEHAVTNEAPVYSLYAHLRPGSTKVKIGAAVRRGQAVGQCGNSGNSSEPHLHFQLMDGPRVESSYGIEPVFANVSVTRNGKSESRADYTFLKDDRVQNAPAVPQK